MIESRFERLTSNSTKVFYDVQCIEPHGSLLQRIEWSKKVVFLALKYPNYPRKKQIEKTTINAM